MKVWQRTRLDEGCSACGQRLPVGAPIQVITLPGSQANARRRVRCAGCAEIAGDAVNVDELEAFDVAEDGREQSVERPRQAFEFTGATRDLFDPKMAQAGDDE